MTESDISTMQFPCKDCPKKGCGSYHTQCDKYNRVREARAAWNKQRSSELAAYYNTPQRDRNIRKALIEGRKLV